MRLAARIGLRVPRVWRRYVPAPVYLIERFDRVASGAECLRSHCIDACQLLDLDRSFKYAEGTVERLADLAALCRNKPQARVRLFEWLVFNVLTGNGDAHLKNLSFEVSHEGIALAPHYDLLSTAVYETQSFGKDGWPGRSELAWPILGVRRFGELNRALLLDAGKALFLARDTCERIAKKQAGVIVARALELLEELQRENVQILEKAHPALGATFAGELRCVRAIVEVVVRDMAARLAK